MLEKVKVPERYLQEIKDQEIDWLREGNQISGVLLGIVNEDTVEIEQKIDLICYENSESEEDGQTLERVEMESPLATTDILTYMTGAFDRGYKLGFVGYSITEDKIDRTVLDELDMNKYSENYAMDRGHLFYNPEEDEAFAINEDEDLIDLETYQLEEKLS